MEMTYEELQKLFTKYFSLPYLGSDMSEKLALVSLVCKLTDLLKEKKPDITHWSVLYQLNKKGSCGVDEEKLKGLSIVCSNFSYGCTKYPDFGIENKDIPKTIIGILKQWLPF